MSELNQEQRIAPAEPQAIVEFQFIVVEEWQGESCIPLAAAPQPAADLPAADEDEWGWGRCID